uniref:Uncharacterized protein n=1 Tax=Panagrellus redivivus TaxID=6233 RepID=A0A7E4VQA1_PANRE
MDMETLLSALIEAMNEVDVKKEQPETRDVATMTDPLSEDLPITDPSTFKDSNMYSNMPDSMDAETRIAEHIDANNHRCALILQFLQGIIDEKKLDISN